MVRIISVVNQKGGVGKTTTAVNFAAGLARAGKKVLLVDIDPQANATSGIGNEKDEEKPSVYHWLFNDETDVSAIQKTEYDDLYLLPSQAALTGAEVELTYLENREYRLKNALSKIEKDYDYILIDCPPSLGLLTLNALTASHGVFIPIQAEYFALEGVGQLMHTLDLVREGLNPNIEVEAVLLTMCDIRTNLSREVMGEVRKFFGDKVLKAYIPRNIKIAESPGFGKPIVYYDMRSIGAEKYLEMTAEYLKRRRS